MARLNTIQLINLATDLGYVSHRVYQTHQDPAVRKSAKIFRDDLARAASSGRDAVGEVRAAWHRTARLQTVHLDPDGRAR